MHNPVPTDLGSDPLKGIIVPVVVCAAFDSNNRVLLLKREKHPYSGYWELAGGRLEFWETGLAAALRELKEETGLIPIESSAKPAGFFEFLLPNYHRIVFAFSCRVDGSKVTLSEHWEFKWFSISELPEPLIPFVKEEVLSGAKALGIV